MKAPPVATAVTTGVGATVTTGAGAVVGGGGATGADAVIAAEGLEYRSLLGLADLGLE